ERDSEANAGTPQTPLLVQLLGLHEPLLTRAELRERGERGRRRRRLERADIELQRIRVTGSRRGADAQAAYGVDEAVLEFAGACEARYEHHCARTAERGLASRERGGDDVGDRPVAFG